jgi:hypothetical protein
MWKYIAAEPGTPHDKRPFIPGIPARDITDEEAKANGWEPALKASPSAYKRATAKPKAESSDEGSNGQ